MSDAELFGQDDLGDDGYGPIVEAGFESECAGSWDTCDGTIYPGDRIRAKAGEWVHEGCEV